MAYSIEQDRIRALLPAGSSSLRPVLRINAEIRNGHSGYVEFNTPVEKDGKRGWLNISFWENVSFVRAGKTVTFQTDFLEISFTGVVIGKTLPAYPEKSAHTYPKEDLTAKNAARIPCRQVLGTYRVVFTRV